VVSVTIECLSREAFSTKYEMATLVKLSVFILRPTYISHFRPATRHYASLLQDSLRLCALACSRFRLILLAVGLVDLLPLLSPALTISTALRSQSLGFSNGCKNTLSISLLTALNTSTPFEMEDPSSIRYPTSCCIQSQKSGFSLRAESFICPGQLKVLSR
jgi:hypothetical protein